MTTLGHTEVIIIVAIVAATGAYLRDGVSLPLVVFGSIVATAAVVLTMKVVIGRERPLPPISLNTMSSASYPSGRSAHAVGSWGALIWMSATGRSARAKSLGALVALSAAVSVGLSRVDLGDHWLSDVIAGWAVGGVCLSVAVLTRSMVRSSQASDDSDAR